MRPVFYTIAAGLSSKIPASEHPSRLYFGSFEYNCGVEHTYLFTPSRRTGYITLGALIIFFSALFAWQVLQSATGSLSAQLSRRFPWMLLSAGGLTLAAYAFRALQGAYYLLSRDGAVLHWGLREVAISAYDILWMAPPENLEFSLPRPWIRLPGAWLGGGQYSDPALGRVEYLASGGKHLVAIATPSGVFVVSPEEPERFLQTFAALAELGSIAPLSPQDIRPGDWLGQSWQHPSVRFLWLASLGLALGLWGMALWGMSRYPRLALGFTAQGNFRAPVPAGSLVLLPLLYSFFLALDWISGQFFYQQEEKRFLAYVLWSAALLTGLGFFGALAGILRYAA